MLTNEISVIETPADYEISYATLSSSGRYIAFYDFDQFVLVIMERSTDSVYEVVRIFAEADLPFDQVKFLNFPPNKKQIFIADYGKNFASISLEDFSLIWHQAHIGQGINLINTLISPDGNQIGLLDLTLSGEFSGVSILNTDSGEFLGGLHFKTTWASEFSSDVEWYITSGTTSIEIWEINDYKDEVLLHTFCESDPNLDFPPPVFATLSSDKSLLFCASSVLDVWDVTTNELLASFDLNLGYDHVDDIWLANNEQALFIATYSGIQRWEIVD